MARLKLKFIPRKEEGEFFYGMSKKSIIIASLTKKSDNFLGIQELLFSIFCTFDGLVLITGRENKIALYLHYRKFVGNNIADSGEYSGEYSADQQGGYTGNTGRILSGNMLAAPRTVRFLFRQLLIDCVPPVKCTPVKFLYLYTFIYMYNVHVSRIIFLLDFSAFFSCYLIIFLFSAASCPLIASRTSTSVLSKNFQLFLRIQR